MAKRRILFLGETYRADAITWMNGLKDFGDFEIVTWELSSKNHGANRFLRLIELTKAFLSIKNIAGKFCPDMVIAERTTSYGFLAALSGIKPIAIAQQGITDLWPLQSMAYPFKRVIQRYAFKKADLIHAWGNVMAGHMAENGADLSKVMVLPKGIDLRRFRFDNPKDKSAIRAIVTRSLEPVYQHALILKAFALLKQQDIPFHLTVIGHGTSLQNLKALATKLNIEKEVTFTGRIDNSEMPNYLRTSNFYVSMPTTEGVSASLFEAMACGCFPIVSDLPGNQDWIQQKVNGILVPFENEFKLAEELAWAFHQNELTDKAVIANRAFVEENANYEINMKKIALKYHDLISASNTIV